VAKRRFQKIPNGDSGKTVLRLPRLERNKIVLTHVNFRRVLDEENSFIAWDESSKDVEQRSFS
jgi:hypothetical protein